MAQTFVNYSCQRFSFLRLVQSKGATIYRYLTHLRTGYKALALQPPEIITALYISWNEKDGNRNLQLTHESQAGGIVIVVSIVERQRQRQALIKHLMLIFARHVKFFQCLLKMQYTVMTTQVEQVGAQVSSGHPMIIENNQAMP